MSVISTIWALGRSVSPSTVRQELPESDDLERTAWPVLEPAEKGS